MGFFQEGFRCLGAYDCDAKALQVHAKNLRSHTVVCDLSHGQLPSTPNLVPDVLLAGAPCQGFSTIGKRDLEDVRNHLLIVAARIAVALRPRCVIAENVPGAMYGAHRKFVDSFLQVLRTAGYNCELFELSARDFGVAQFRRRLFIAGTLVGTFGPPKMDPGRVVNVREAIGDISRSTRGLPNHEPEILEADSMEIRISKRIAAGQKLCDVRDGCRSVHTWEIPEVFGATTRAERDLLVSVLRLRRRERCRESGDADPVSPSSLERYLQRPVAHEIESLLRKRFLKRVGTKVDLRHTFNGKFRRLHWDHPSFTVDTRFGQARNFLHPEEQRGLSVREAARIQGFPDSFVFEGSTADQFKYVGNAVPPPLSRALAKIARKVVIL